MEILDNKRAFSHNDNSQGASCFNIHTSYTNQKNLYSNEQNIDFILTNQTNSSEVRSASENTEKHYLTDSLDLKIRHGFIRRVYILLSILTCISFSIILFFTYYKPAFWWISTHYWISIVCSISAMILVIFLAFFPSIAQNHKVGMTVLFSLSVLYAVGISGLAVHINQNSVIIAFTSSIGIFLMLSLFAAQVKYDFTGYGPYLVIGLLVMLIYGFALFILNLRSFLMTIYGALGVIISSLYIVYDTQLIIGGKHRKYKFSIDDYIFATLSLYLDIVNICAYLLTIFSTFE
ncbi:hypothetical protein cand_015440 [Cryptosporidium andersoni]|uniref:Uncharacterized protein n=1 Tax=Cryptosporidium andersoni TaxID=117008 RepID=A0A1J4MU72_9CRYT|nr:hypothetical protein cand_015440 [Cryptosporidium andersoni]